MSRQTHATASPTACPAAPDTRDRLAAVGLSSFGAAITEGAALDLLAKAGDICLDGAPDCAGNHGGSWHCETCVFSAECLTITKPKTNRRRTPPPPKRGR
jgi:hypothetical protein